MCIALDLQREDTAVASDFSSSCPAATLFAEHMFTHVVLLLPTTSQESSCLDNLRRLLCALIKRCQVPRLMFKPARPNFAVRASTGPEVPLKNCHALRNDSVLVGAPSVCVCVCVNGKRVCVARTCGSAASHTTTKLDSFFDKPCILPVADSEIPAVMQTCACVLPGAYSPLLCSLPLLLPLKNTDELIEEPAPLELCCPECPRLFASNLFDIFLNNFSNFSSLSSATAAATSSSGHCAVAKVLPPNRRIASCDVRPGRGRIPKIRGGHERTAGEIAH